MTDEEMRNEGLTDIEQLAAAIRDHVTMAKKCLDVADTRNDLALVGLVDRLKNIAGCALTILGMCDAIHKLMPEDCGKGKCACYTKTKPNKETEK